jgi:hypothetical protein
MAAQPTLILSPRYTEDSQRLWQAAVQRSWHVERLLGWRVPAELKRVAEPVLYVEALMAPMVAEELGLRLSEPPDDWLPRLPRVYRQREVHLSTLGAARALSAPAFTKPPNDKSFPARVYQPGELPHEYPDDTPVLVAEVVRWECEFRCFVLDRTLRAASIYLRDGQLQREQGFAAPEEELAAMETFVAQVLADPRVLLPQAIVLDVGVIAERGWAVVECNAAWGAGIYGCDPEAVLEVLRHAAEQQNGLAFVPNEELGGSDRDPR